MKEFGICLFMYSYPRRLFSLFLVVSLFCFSVPARSYIDFVASHIAVTSPSIRVKKKNAKLFFSLEEKKRKEINLILFYRYSPFRFIFVVVFLLLLTWAAAIERCHRDRIQHGHKPIVVVGIIAPAHSENRAGYYVRNDKKQSDSVSPSPPSPANSFFFLFLVPP
jgi:hypothetical protein